MRRSWLLFVLAACGQVEKTTPDAKRVDAPPMIDARPDAPAIDAMIDAPAGHVVPANPALWLRMDDAPADGVLDSAATPHVAACTSCPVLDTGVFSSAYKFASNRVDVTSATDLGPNGAFTIAAWVRLDVPTAGVTVIACKNQGANDCTYGLLVEDTGVAGYYTQGSGHLMGTMQLGVGTWHHLAMTWDGATKTGYLDGVVATSAAQSAPTNDGGALSIGDRLSPPIPFQGAIDDVVFYDRALTATEVASLAQP